MDRGRARRAERGVSEAAHGGVDVVHVAGGVDATSERVRRGCVRVRGDDM